MESNPIYNEFISSGLELFKQYGYKKVSIEDICKKSGISKMTFYKYFKNKLELMKCIIDRNTNDAMSRYREIMSSDISFNRKIEQMIIMKLEFSDKYGPILIKDIIENVKELHDYIFSLQADTIAASIEMYKAGVKEGYIRKNITEQYFVFTLNYFTRMLDDPEYIRLFPDISERIREGVELFFYGIYNFREKE